MACTLGDRSDGIANEEPFFLFTMPDLVIDRNGAILLRDKTVVCYRGLMQGKSV